MPEVVEPWIDRLAGEVRRRREQMGLTQDELAQAGGKNLSVATVGLIERAGRTQYRGLTMRALCVALGWSEDSIERIQRGDQPRQVVFPHPLSHHRLERMDQETRKDVVAALDADPNLTDQQRDAIKQMYSAFVDTNQTTRPSGVEAEPEGP